MINPESKRPIQIEDLLRLKRAERPPAEFWTEFDRQLRAKQLSALVAKRPWWQRLPRLTSFVRYSVPLGAAAALAVTFVSLRENGSPAATTSPQKPSAATPAVPNITTAAAPAPSPSVRHASTDTEISSPRSEPASVAAARNADLATAPTALASEATTPGELSKIIPLLGASGPLPAAESTTGARYAATSFISEPAGEHLPARNLMGATVSLGTRSAVVEPLQQIALPGERRHSKILTAMASMQSANQTFRSIGPARTADRLSEESLYDTARRFGTAGSSGPGVSMKF